MKIKKGKNYLPGYMANLSETEKLAKQGNVIVMRALPEFRDILNVEIFHSDDGEYYYRAFPNCFGRANPCLTREKVLQGFHRGEKKFELMWELK